MGRRWGPPRPRRGQSAFAPGRLRRRISCLAILAAAACVPLSAQTGGTGGADSELLVVIRGLESDDGQLMIALFDSEATFGTDQALRAEALPIANRSCEWVVPDLTPGSYAIAVYHDENGNGELDSNFLGIPQEPYGFSNNARGRFGPPGFDDASFRAGGSSVVLEIEVK